MIATLPTAASVARRPRIDALPDGAIHAVGAAGLETASMVRYLLESGTDPARIVLHDQSADLAATWARTHRFQPRDHRDRAWRALSACAAARTGGDYLAGVHEASAVLLPVAWFLDPVNQPLAALTDRWVTFPDACFDLWPGPVVGVSGSYGKTSTTGLVATLTDGLFCGNDRESRTDLTELARADGAEVLAFELSNRHLRNGFRRRIEVGVLTGLSLNHERDHGSYSAYRQVKYSLGQRCQVLLHAEGIPRDFADARGPLAGAVSYGPTGVWRLVADELHGPGVRLPLALDPDTDPLDRVNLLPAAAAALTVDTPASQVAQRTADLTRHRGLYRHARRIDSDRLVINDAAACMPASTAGLVATLRQPFVLICGGDRERFRAGEFDDLARSLQSSPWARAVVTTGPMAPAIETALDQLGRDVPPVHRASDIPDAVRWAWARTRPGMALVFSPGCGTGTLFVDKYERGEVFDRAVADVSAPTAHRT